MNARRQVDVQLALFHHVQPHKHETCPSTKDVTAFHLVKAMATSESA